MSSKIRRHEQWMCRFLRASLNGKKLSEKEWAKLPSDANWNLFLMSMSKHGILPSMYEILADYEGLPENEKKALTGVSRMIVYQNYHLAYISARVVRLMEEAGIPVLILKGVVTASYYPIPEMRKSGDVDLLLSNPEDAEKAFDVFEANGFTVQREHHIQHQVVATAPAGIDIEIHISMAEPFDNQEINGYLSKLQKASHENVEQVNALGELLPSFTPPYHAYYLMIHMLQHFLRSGFGLRMICDWVVFWNAPQTDEAKDTFLRLAQESGLAGFARKITAACIRYLGLKEENMVFLMQGGASIRKEETEQFLREVLDAEEFGKTAADRMVVLRGTGLMAYVREFHHQMRLNHPKTGHIIPLWPVLWVITFVVFVRNNKRIRGVSTLSILKKAAERSRISRTMRLFRK